MKAKLVFKGSEVRKLIDDSKQATERSIPYVGSRKNVPVGLLLVKDDGVYLISNAVTKQTPSESGLIAYATGYGPPSKLDDQDARATKSAGRLAAMILPRLSRSIHRPRN